MYSVSLYLLIGVFSPFIPDVFMGLLGLKLSCLFIFLFSVLSDFCFSFLFPGFLWVTRTDVLELCFDPATGFSSALLQGATSVAVLGIASHVQLVTACCCRHFTNSSQVWKTYFPLRLITFPCL